MRKLKRNEDREEVVVHELLSNARINIKLMGNNESKLLGYIYIHIYIYILTSSQFPLLNHINP